MASRDKHRSRQKYRVLQAQEYLADLHPLQFSALQTALDDLDDLPDIELEEWGNSPRDPTTWEKIKGFLFGSDDAESN